MKGSRFDGDNEGFKFGHVKSEIIQTYPSGIVIKELDI